MKISLHTAVQLLSLAGLITVAALETLRPGTVGAAVNLGLVILFGGAVLAIKKASAD